MVSVGAVVPVPMPVHEVSSPCPLLLMLPALFLSPELFCNKLAMILSASMPDSCFIASASCFSSSDRTPAMGFRNRRCFMEGSLVSGFRSREMTDLPEDVRVWKTEGRAYVPIPEWEEDNDMNGFMLVKLGFDNSPVACNPWISFWMLS